MGTRHRFWNPSETEDLELLVKTVPAHDGFEKSLYLFYGLANNGESDSTGKPSSFVTRCLVGDMADIQFTGPLKWLGGGLVVRWVAAYARWSGLEDRLLERYWCEPGGQAK